MAKSVQALAAFYARLEAKWAVVDRSADYARLVGPTGNAEEPVHRWFHMKEAYSHALFDRLVKDRGHALTSSLEILDPFVGSGTTIVSAITRAHDAGVACRAVGIERNPILRVIAHAKSAAMVGGSSLAEKVADYRIRFHADYNRVLRSRRSLSTPSVTLLNEEYFPADHRVALLALGKAASCIDDPDVKSVFQTCVATAVEPAGRLRRDGRALRFEPRKPTAHPECTFEATLDSCITDMAGIPQYTRRVTADVFSGDARRPNDALKSRKFDWIVCSPPYPNNIDYTEVYKTEAWALGLYSDIRAMKEQRLATVRSHTSLYFPERYAYSSTESTHEFESLVAPLLASVPADRYTRGRKQLIAGYADDMFTVFRGLRSHIRTEGTLAVVVGNSVHGSGDSQFVIASDLLLSAVAEFAGWKVDEIRVARRLRRRAEDLEHLRESIVILRPA